MASITWYDDGWHDGRSAASKTGLEICMEGTQLPYNAVFTQVACYQAISSSSYSTSKQIQLYFLKRADGSTVIFNGSPAATSQMGSSSGSPSSANNFHSHCTAVYTMYNSSAQNAYNYLRGSSGANFFVQIYNNKSGSDSYWRAGKLEFIYYIRCGDPSNVVAVGGQRSLSATWTRGSNGTDDVANHYVCYNTSKTWNSSTAAYTSGTSAAWTINTPGTYYVGVRVTGSSSGDHSIVWSQGVQVTANSAPSLVSAIKYPAASNTYTYNVKPRFRATLGTDPDGDNLYLGWSLYDSTTQTWPVSTTWLSSAYAGGTTISWQCSTSLTRGHTYILYCYQKDPSGLTASGTAPSRTFIVGTPASAVSSGNLIDDATMDNLQTQVNRLRAYYGLSAYSFSTINAGTSALATHISQLKTAFEATPYKTTVAAVSAGTQIVPSNVNNIRTGLLNG